MAEIRKATIEIPYSKQITIAYQATITLNEKTSNEKLKNEILNFVLNDQKMIKSWKYGKIKIILDK